MVRSNMLVAFVLVVAPLAFSGSAAAQARTFKVDERGSSSFQFVSDAPLEKFTGRSTSLSGEITVDPAKLAAGPKAEIRAQVGSIKTNVTLRDEHLVGEGWLDAKKHPQAKLVITKISGATKLKTNDVTELKVSGKFTMHGVTKDIHATAKVRFTPGQKASLHIVSSFTVHLEDYKVSVPAVVSLKVSPDIVVNVDIRAAAGA